MQQPYLVVDVISAIATAIKRTWDWRWQLAIRHLLFFSRHGPPGLPSRMGEKTVREISRTNYSSKGELAFRGLRDTLSEQWILWSMSVRLESSRDELGGI